jgi:hypothetical protein
MINLYKEGNKLEKGINIGWIRGPLLYYCSLSRQENCIKVWQWRFNVYSRKLIKSSFVERDYQLYEAKDYITRCVSEKDLKDLRDFIGVRENNIKLL